MLGDCCSNKHLEFVYNNSSIRIMQAILREGLLRVVYQDNKMIFLLPQTTRTLYVDTIQLGSLARYRTFGNIYIQEENASIHQITNPMELLEICSAELQEEFDEIKWQTFSQEINDHLRNALLMSYKNCHLNKQIAEDSLRANTHNILTWLASREEIKDTTIFLEQWASRGHPYHPCSKTKLGFSSEDVINYSPEFYPEVPIILAAVHKEYMHIESMHLNADYGQWFAEAFPDVWRGWCQEIQNRQLSVADYIPLPVHPWQANKKIPELFADLIEQRILLLFESVTILSSPTLSFRTLAPIAGVYTPYIKLPVAVQATSIFRTLSPATTENTPRISRLMQAILVKENYFRGSLNVVCELYGLHMKYIPDEKAMHLTAIFRENPQAQLLTDEICIVVAALFEKSPITELSLFIELMHAAGVCDLEDAIDYFRQYADLVLGSYLDLYLKYGIALEGHQQNTLAVFKHGQIVRFIARDFDGMYAHEESLLAQGFTLPVYPESTNLWKDIAYVRRSFLHSVYQLHLGELVLLLANHFQCEESIFWQEIRDATLTRFYNLKEEMRASAWHAEMNAILKEDWPCKALLRMRLQQRHTPGGLYLKIVNPLC